MRLQLRSSLVKPAKKVIGKQRLTVLVNVSFPAPTPRTGTPFETSPFCFLRPPCPSRSSIAVIVHRSVVMAMRSGRRRDMLSRYA